MHKHVEPGEQSLTRLECFDCRSCQSQTLTQASQSRAQSDWIGWCLRSLRCTSLQSYCLCRATAIVNRWFGLGSVSKNGMRQHCDRIPAGEESTAHKCSPSSVLAFLRKRRPKGRKIVTHSEVFHPPNLSEELWHILLPTIILRGLWSVVKESLQSCQQLREWPAVSSDAWKSQRTFRPQRQSKWAAQCLIDISHLLTSFAWNLVSDGECKNDQTRSGEAFWSDLQRFTLLVRNATVHNNSR